MVELLPRDLSNEQQVAHAHPPERVNPTPAGRYNLVAIGGGPAGLIAAAGAAALGGRAALIERPLLGGECLGDGRVSSTALLRAARAIHDASDLRSFDCQVAGPPKVDFAALMDRLRRWRSDLAACDAARLAGPGVDVFSGEAQFTAPDSLEVAGQALRFTRAVIATGARPAVSSIVGLDEAGYLTSETVFESMALPRRLLIVGGGATGCELAQAFRRLGSEVFLVERATRLLAEEAAEAAHVLLKRLRGEGVRVLLAAEVQEVGRLGEARLTTIRQAGEMQKLLVDEIVVAVGRAADVAGLGLEAAGVRASAAGIEVDDFLRTSNPRIYAAGEVIAGPRLPQTSEAMARLCLRNALFPGRRRASRLVVPRTTYTDPEIAQVGLTPEEADRQQVAIDTYRVELRDVDRVVLDMQTEGFAAFYTRRGSGRLVGATIVARHAGDLIMSVTLAMTKKLSLGALGEMIHGDSTQAAALKLAADAYRRARLTPRLTGLVRRWLAWRR